MARQSIVILKQSNLSLFGEGNPNKAIKQENLQLAVFTAFNILASYKFPLIEALGLQSSMWSIINSFFLFSIIILILYLLKKSIVDNSRPHSILLDFIGGVLILIGILGCIAMAIYVTSEDDDLWAFEWPIGNAHNALKISDNKFVVLHDTLPRIQVYDSSLNYINGWRFDTHQFHSLSLYPNDANSFYLYSHRGNIKYLYKLNGELINESEIISSLPMASEVLYDFEVSPAIYKKATSNIFRLYFLIIAGLFLTFGVRKCKPNKLINKD